MIENQKRIGNFTSSNMHRLCESVKSGEPSSAFYTYVEEKMYERSLCRSLEMGAYSRSMAWGKFLEMRVNNFLGLEYELINKQTFSHPKFPFWTGSPDFRVPKVKVSELKCYEPKMFASYVSALATKDTEKIKDAHTKEYWQIVSNAIIHNVPKGEAIVYMPYASEMDEIRELSEDPMYLDKIGIEPWEVRFISELPNSKLAVLPDESKFSNLNVFEFEIPQDDIVFLTKRVLMAEKLLTNE